MFGTIGGPELLLVLVIALIVFGPRQLPEIGKSLGRMLVEFRRAGNDFKRTLEDEVETDKLRSALPAQIEAPAPREPLPPASDSAPSDSVPTGSEPATSEPAVSEPAAPEPAAEPAATGENK